MTLRKWLAAKTAGPENPGSRLLPEYRKRSWISGITLKNSRFSRIILRERERAVLHGGAA